MTSIPEQGQSDPSRHELELRQLALVDRVLGLEARVAELTIAVSRVPGPVVVDGRAESLAQELAAIRSSTTWRVGSLVLTPVRILRGIAKRIR
ncbi:hypothetical protein ACFJGV_05575 [Cnuibacter sp. UC19_7]|uniref:hypothetical protein n=1 Tax=Cnuibacter sp. UC19_7 TaxID=3350166 RepID=UPI00366BE8E3